MPTWNDSALAAFPSSQLRLEVKSLRAAALSFGLYGWVSLYPTHPTDPPASPHLTELWPRRGTLMFKTRLVPKPYLDPVFIGAGEVREEGVTDESSGNFTAFDILHHAVALKAIHDSTDSFMEPKCHPETRTKLLKDLRDWAVETRPKTTILWLYGPAGAGKSAIMQTLATQLDEDGRLGVGFFFKYGHATRGNARTLFTTIAYQLALNVQWLRAPISQVVEQNPSLVARSIAVQRQELIYKPCRTHDHHDPIVILIDGLDECDRHSVQVEILRTIRSTSLNHPLLPRFIVASRAEAHIREMFDSPIYDGHHRSVNLVQSFDDVRNISVTSSREFTVSTAQCGESHDLGLRPTYWKNWFIDDKYYRPTCRRKGRQVSSNSSFEHTVLVSAIVMITDIDKVSLGIGLGNRPRNSGSRSALTTPPRDTPSFVPEGRERKPVHAGEGHAGYAQKPREVNTMITPLTTIYIGAVSMRPRERLDLSAEGDCIFKLLSIDANSGASWREKVEEVTEAKEAKEALAGTATEMGQVEQEAMAWVQA
ncbi:NACHT domain-containing protein [Mycena sanguinolenta]|uniref:NACHT domain-containing protein n=1 Tax=Mycena sanguinolenta TaxID=230812 RepID=A0A8H6U2C0_9AGAR|nr:NACHT domain-containing protein [Mycena sanguinolenta]